MPDSRETIIRLDYDLKKAEIWTENQALQRRLLKLGAKQLEKQALGCWFETPIEWWKPRPKRKGTGGGGFKRKPAPEVGVSAPNPPHPAGEANAAGD